MILTFKKIIGISILSLPFVGITIHMIRESGILIAVKVWIAAIIFIITTVFAIYLVGGNFK